MKTVVIPNNESIWTCSINGVTYSYPGGSTQTVPDEVAMMIMQMQGYPPAEPEPEMPWVPKDDTVFIYLEGTSSADIHVVGYSHDLNDIHKMFMSENTHDCALCLNFGATRMVVPASVNAQSNPSNNSRSFQISGIMGVSGVANGTYEMKNVYTISPIYLLNTDSGNGWGEWTISMPNVRMARGAVQFVVDKTASKKVGATSPVSDVASMIQVNKEKQLPPPAFLVKFVTHDAKNTVYNTEGFLVHDNTGSRIEVNYNGTQLCYITIENNAWVYNDPVSEE